MTTTKPPPPGLDKPWVPSVIRVMSAVNTWLYRRTGGRLGGSWRVMAGFRKPAPVLLLTVTGRRSGQPHTVPLLYVRDGDDLVVAGSTGGLPHHPQWYRNILANPSVTVQVGSEIHERTAHVVAGEERARLWHMLNDTYADFETYATWTEREIPVVVLTSRT